MDLEEELDKINVKPDPASVMFESTDTNMKPLQLPSIVTPIIHFGLQSKEELSCTPESDVDWESGWWKKLYKYIFKKTY